MRIGTALRTVFRGHASERKLDDRTAALDRGEHCRRHHTGQGDAGVRRHRKAREECCNVRPFKLLEDLAQEAEDAGLVEIEDLVRAVARD